MSQGWSKVFSRINWMNRPNKATSLGATNLNKSDYALDKIDDRVITLDTIKADKTEVNGMVSDVDVNESNGVITITYKDGSTKKYDTNLEKIAVNFNYDSESERLILTMPDGTTQYVDLSALITQFEFANSSTIAFSVDSSGKVSATIKNGSITEAMLETGYLANIKTEVAKAEAAASQAQSSATSSDYNAQLSRSYAIGGSGIREGEDTDNAMYYNEQAQEALSKMQAAQVTGVKGDKEENFRNGEVNLTAENIGAVAIDGDTAENTVTFTSTDSKDVTEYTDVDVLASGEKHKSFLEKIATMFKNVRYLYKMLGSTDISSIGDGTVTGGLSTLNSNINARPKILYRHWGQSLDIPKIICPNFILAVGTNMYVIWLSSTNNVAIHNIGSNNSVKSSTGSATFDNLTVTRRNPIDSSGCKITTTEYSTMLLIYY